MPSAPLTAALQNAALLLALAVVYDLATHRRPIAGSPLRQALAGAILGGIGIAIMLAPVGIEPGIVIDTRSVLLAVSGLFLGAVPTAVAMAMTAAFRLFQGGAAWAGVSVILSSGGIGIAWRHWRRKPLEDVTWRELYALGAAVHLVMLALMLTLRGESARRAIVQLGLPVLLVYPIATAALGALLVNRLRRERTTTLLAESESRYRALFEDGHAAMLLIDPHGGAIVDANPTACRFYGWTRGQLQGMRITDVNTLPPDEVQAAMDRARAPGGGRFLFRHRRADGSVRDVEVFGGPVAIQGRPLLYSMVHDVSDRTRAEAAARESALRLQMALRSARIGIHEWNPVTGELIWDERVYEFWGLPPGTPVSHEVFVQRVHPGDRARVRVTIERLLEPVGDGRCLIQFRAGGAGGRERWLELSGQMSYESARAVRFLGTVTDITARKQAEEEARRLFDEADASRRVLLSVIEDLKQAEAEVRRLNAELEQRVRDRTAQLRAANKELEAFSYSVSHDLRAPLRAINGYARILAEDHGPRLDADSRRMLDTVRSESLRMGALIDDLLRFSRLGRQRLRKTSTDMTALVGEIHAELRRSLPDRTVEFRLGGLPDAPADPALVRQIWVNLLDNAFKFTRRRERAEIAVSGTVHGGEAVYSVHDNGAGFEMRHAGRLFGVFQRLHPAEDFEGTGVGLALVQRLVQRHGGRVWAEAEPERGATFHFTLPLAADAVPSPDDAEERPEG